MRLTLAQCNVHAPGSTTARRKTIKLATDVADVVTFNEAIRSHDLIRAVPGFDAVYPDGFAANLVTAWRRDRFRLVDADQVKVMDGGHVGADGTRKGPDNRRTGPDRYAAWVVLEDEHGERVGVLSHHAIARAFTSSRWRIGLWRKGIANTGQVLADLQAEFPGVPWLIDGDWNTDLSVVDFPGVDEVPVPTPPTFGRRRYDRLSTLADVRVLDVRTVKTPSDHLTLVAEVTTTPGAPATPHERPLPPERRHRRKRRRRRRPKARRRRLRRLRLRRRRRRNR